MEDCNFGLFPVWGDDKRGCYHLCPGLRVNVSACNLGKHRGGEWAVHRQAFHLGHWPHDKSRCSASLSALGCVHFFLSCVCLGRCAWPLAGGSGGVLGCWCCHHRRMGWGVTSAFPPGPGRPARVHTRVFLCLHPVSKHPLLTGTPVLGPGSPLNTWF